MAFTIPMLRSQCNLWDLTAMGPAPTGWEQVGFDDSAWPSASSFSPTQTSDGGQDFHIFHQDGSDSSTSTFSSPLPYGAEAVAPWTVPPSSTASFLIRWTFLGPPLPPDTLTSMYEDFSGLGFGANTGLAWLNGNEVLMFNGLSWAFGLLDAAAGVNLVALAPQCNWSTLTAGWFSMALTSLSLTSGLAVAGVGVGGNNSPRNQLGRAYGSIIGA